MLQIGRSAARGCRLLPLPQAHVIACCTAALARADELGWRRSWAPTKATVGVLRTITQPAQAVRTGTSRKRLWDLELFLTFVREGNLDALERGRKDLGGLVWSTGSCVEAAKAGQLDVLKYLRKHGCPWDEWTCFTAASEGHLDVLKYARENGCPWEREECRSLASQQQTETIFGHTHIVAYIDAQRE